MVMNASNDALQIIRERFHEIVPHSKEIGMTIDETGDGWAIMSLPYQPFMLGDQERGLIHSSVVTSLVDTCSGLSVFCALPEYQNIATLDLRLDFMRPAVSEKTIYCRAECHRLTHQIGFSHAIVYQDSPDNPLATAQGTFMRASSKNKGRK